MLTPGKWLFLSAGNLIVYLNTKALFPLCDENLSKIIETFWALNEFMVKVENKRFWHFPDSVFFANSSHLSL